MFRVKSHPGAGEKAPSPRPTTQSKKTRRPRKVSGKMATSTSAATLVDTTSTPPNTANKPQGPKRLTSQDTDDSAPSTPTNGGTSTSSSTESYHRTAQRELLQATGNNSFVTFMRKVFKQYGTFIASQPWEVIVVSIVLLISILTYCHSLVKHDTSISEESSCQVTDFYTGNYQKAIALGVLSSVSMINLMVRFKKISQIGSCVFYISISYIIMTFMLYSLVIWAVGGPDMQSMHDAWFFVPLLNDLPKVARMAQIALCTSHSRRISENVSNAMYVLAPVFIRDTLDKIMFFCFGFYCVPNLLGRYAWYSMVSAIVNFAIFFSFYPAGLAILIDLWMFNDGRPKWDVRQIISTLPSEEGEIPVVQKFRMMASSLMFCAHIFIAPTLFLNVKDQVPIDSLSSFVLYMIHNPDRTICLIAAAAFTIYYLCTDDVDEARVLRRTCIEALERNFLEDNDQTHFKHTTNPMTDSSADEGIASSLSSQQQKLVSRVTPDDLSSEWSVDVTVPGMCDNDTGPMPPYPRVVDQETQTGENPSDEDTVDDTPAEPRSLEECKKVLMNAFEGGAPSLTDEEVMMLLDSKDIKAHNLEKVLNNHMRGVQLRRRITERRRGSRLDGLPFTNYEYENVMGACCESVIGYMTLPVGVAGPLVLDGQSFMVPMATTEGCLVASVNRGCSALRMCGVTSQVTGDGMTRSPILRFPTIKKMGEAKMWLEHPDNFAKIKSQFDSTSRFARLQSLKVNAEGRNLFVRFVAKTGDAMGMNMVSKATEHSLHILQDAFPEMEVLALSGNFCTDKKPAAINWIDGRGKSVICEAVVPARVVKSVLKTTPQALADLNLRKNLTGSALAGASVGGFNAQAANVVTSIFIATGQDAAQNVASSNCLTQMEVMKPTATDPDCAGDLYVSVTMPSIEVGTVGGGTILTAQGACLDLLGVKGSHTTSPGENATQLARVVCATVLAGELSLMSALAAGHLVKSHLRHNRSHLAVTSCNSQQSLASPFGLSRER